MTKYGCTWTSQACSQPCGCCKDCVSRCPFMCGVFLHNVDKKIAEKTYPIMSSK